ncbi:MAG: DUF4280 domain-containing protein [Syntrophomonas sp.]
MSMLVCGGAMLQCTFGTTPSPLVVLPINRVISTMPVANIMDNKPGANILPFGMCNSPSNPAVIAATSAAMGVFTPAPCLPVTTAPWVPGSPTVIVGNMPALSNTCKLMCTWGGMVQVNTPGQFTILVP